MLISIDGIDGCGKSTQINKLQAALGAGYHIEISPTEWGKKLRAMESPTLAEQLACFLADRVENVEKLRRHAGSETEHLVSDRSWLSTVAYQSFQSDLSPDFLEELNRVIVPDYDLMIVLDLPVEISLERVSRRGEALTWCEKPDRLAHCRQVYLDRAAGMEHAVVISAAPGPDEVGAAVMAAVEAASQRRFGRRVW